MDKCFCLYCYLFRIRDKVGMMHLYYMAGLSDRLRDYVGKKVIVFITATKRCDKLLKHKQSISVLYYCNLLSYLYE